MKISLIILCHALIFGLLSVYADRISMGREVTNVLTTGDVFLRELEKELVGAPLRELFVNRGYRVRFDNAQITLRQVTSDVYLLNCGFDVAIETKFEGRVKELIVSYILGRIKGLSEAYCLESLRERVDFEGGDKMRQHVVAVYPYILPSSLELKSDWVAFGGEEVLVFKVDASLVQLEYSVHRVKSSKEIIEIVERLIEKD